MDDARFERLYREHGPRVLGYCLFRLGTRTDAEDAAAETFARLLAGGDKIPDERAEAWLLRVAQRVCVDVWRRARRESPSDSLPDSPAEDDQFPGWTDPSVRDAVIRLRPEQQHVLYLRVVADMPFSRVAELVGRSEPAVRMQYHRAIRLLARQLDGAGR